MITMLGTILVMLITPRREKLDHQEKRLVNKKERQRNSVNASRRLTHQEENLLKRNQNQLNQSQNQRINHLQLKQPLKLKKRNFMDLMMKMPMKKILV